MQLLKSSVSAISVLSLWTTFAKQLNKQITRFDNSVMGQEFLESLQKKD